MGTGFQVLVCSRGLTIETRDQQGETITNPNPPKLRIANQITGHKSEVELILDDTRIGRAPGRNELVFNDDRVSREHATIRRVNNTYVLTDHDSANGTFVNGLRIKERVLSNHDAISIGNYALVYEEQEGLPSFSFDNMQMGAVVLRDPERITLSAPQKQQPAGEKSVADAPGRRGCPQKESGDPVAPVRVESRADLGLFPQGHLQEGE